MRTGIVFGLLALTASIACHETLQAQESRCADCHFANSPSLLTAQAREAQAHLQSWEHSAHAKAKVGCDGCHGGNPTTFEPSIAHRGVLRWMDPDSPIHRANIPRTCGRCHAGALAAFQRSRHYALLQGRNPVVPTCTTCHGYAGENRPSPAALERECATCHRPGRGSDHPEFPALGRRMLDDVRESRAMLKEARAMIARVKDPSRRGQLSEAARQADVPLGQAIDASHTFVYDGLDERLKVARGRLVGLFEALVNPSQEDSR